MASLFLLSCVAGVVNYLNNGAVVSVLADIGYSLTETAAANNTQHCPLPKEYFNKTRPRILMIHFSSLQMVGERLQASYQAWIKEFLDEPEEDEVMTFVSSKKKVLTLDTKIVPHLTVALTPCPDTYKVGSVCRFYEAVRWIATQMDKFEWVYFLDDDTLFFPHNLRHVLMEKRCQFKDRPFTIGCYGCAAKGFPGFCGGCGFGFSMSSFRYMQKLYPLEQEKWIAKGYNPVWGPSGWHPNISDSNPLQGVMVRFLKLAWQLHEAGDLWHDVAAGRLANGAQIDNINLLDMGIQGWPMKMPQYLERICRCDHPPILYHYVDSPTKKKLKKHFDKCPKVSEKYEGPGHCSWN